MKEVLHRYEGIVLSRSEVKHEMLCEFIPVATWYLFRTNHGREFTCRDTFKYSEENSEKQWKDVEFDSIQDGRHYPF